MKLHYTLTAALLLLTFCACDAQTQRPATANASQANLEQAAIADVQQRAGGGDKAAMHELYRRFANGVGAPKNLPEALKWLQKAADAGDPEAMVGLGLAYQHPEGVPTPNGLAVAGLGLEKDAKRAVTLFRKAADAGFAGGMFNLALAYEAGEGIDKDLTEARKLFLKAAATGDIDANNKLGVRYATGLLFEQSASDAEKCFLQAAQKGNGEGMFNLAVLMAKQGNDAAAQRWMAKAAESGFAPAVQAMQRNR